MRIRFGVLMLALALAFSAQAQRPGQLRGTVTDKKSGEEQYQAIVRVLSGGYEIAKGTTDFDGNYNINPVQPGTYTLSVSQDGYFDKIITFEIEGCDSLNLELLMQPDIPDGLVDTFENTPLLERKIFNLVVKKIN